MFNVWTVIMQSLNIQERTLLELQTKKMSKFKTPQNEKKNIYNRVMCIK